MAVARTARIDRAHHVGASARAIDLRLSGDETLGFVGGQYVIVDTGVDLPNGKRAKRAYSIASSDCEQHGFRLIVKLVQPGHGSHAMHSMAEGSTVTFSGPWGKYVPDALATGDALVFATDTGITAAIGLLRGSGFAHVRAGVRVVWYTCGDDDFVPESFVRDALGPFAERLTVEPALAVDHPERAVHALQAALRHDARGTAFLSGDGAVVHPVRDALVARGVQTDQVRLESFFNNPARKSP